MTQMNLCTEQKKLTDTQNRLVIAKEGVSGGGTGQHKETVMGLAAD